MEVLRVSTKSNPNAVAGALAGVIRERGSAELQTIGVTVIATGKLDDYVPTSKGSGQSQC